MSVKPSLSRIPGKRIKNVITIIMIVGPEIGEAAAAAVAASESYKINLSLKITR